MTIPLQNYQWELGDYVFGWGCPVDSEPDSQVPYWSNRSQDSDNPNGDGRQFGVDLLQPGTWQFKLFTNVGNEREALDELRKFAKVWRGDAVRKTPNGVMALRHRIGGVTSVVYGRPRRFSAPLDNNVMNGVIKITCDFDVVSELFFDDADSSIGPIGMIAPASGGFSTPLRAPIRTHRATSSAPGSFTVGGELPTPAIFEITGPIEGSNGFIEIDGQWRAQLVSPVGVNQKVTIDARPWVMAAYLPDGTGIGLSRRTQLSKMLLEPGDHTMVFGGTDPSGTARATVRWRPARPSL